MEYTVLVEIDEGLENLIKETLSLFLRKWLATFRPHILLKVELKVFED